MPLDVYLGFLYLLRTDLAYQAGEQALELAKIREAEEMMKLRQASGFYAIQ